jgi:hypothetical protein
MNLNELTCPACDERMIVIYDQEDKYAAHGCKKCKMFHTLGNPHEYT